MARFIERERVVKLVHNTLNLPWKAEFIFATVCVSKDAHALTGSQSVSKDTDTGAKMNPGLHDKMTYDDRL